jgi:uncharacterized protein (DUF1697 family)
MKYAAFFRGINVGGKNKVKMADLRQLFEDCGFRGAETYIQSGNVLFEVEQAQDLLPAIISHAFAERFGFNSPAVLRSSDEITGIILALPFTKDEIDRAETENPEVEHVYIFMTNSDIDPVAAASLRRAYSGEDQLCAEKRELYLLCHQSVRDSKLAAALLKLDASLTSRNLKTMLKINEMLNS